MTHEQEQPRARVERTLSYWRSRLLRGILVALVVLTALPAVMTSWAYVETGQLGLAVLMFLYYPIFVALAWIGDRIDYRVRAHLLFATLTGTNAEAWLIAGYEPTGTVPLIITVFAALVLGRRGGTLWLLVNLVLIVFTQQARFEHTLGYTIQVTGEVAAVGVALLFSSTYLVEQLERSRTAEVEAAERARNEAAARLREMTRRREAELELRDAQRLSSLGLLTAGIVHDLNNTLAASMGNVELALMDLEPEHPVRADLGEALESLHSSAALTSELLRMVRKQSHEPSFVDVRAIVGETVDLVRRLIPSSIELVLELGERTPTVIGSNTQLQQIVLNLVINARDAVARAGGRIEVGLREVELDAQPAVCIHVRDDGIGMDPETQAHIFEPMFTTKQGDRGTGLGLSVVATLVKECSGKIEVESARGRGTTFKVTIPTVEPLDAHADARVIAPAPRGVGQIVLLADDDERLLNVLTRLLQRAGFEVVAARDGHQAVELAAGLDRYDLLICDTVMPGPAGITLARRLAAPRVLLISGYNPDDDTRQAVETESIELIAKPFAAAELVDAVERLLA